MQDALLAPPNLADRAAVFSGKRNGTTDAPGRPTPGTLYFWRDLVGAQACASPPSTTQSTPSLCVSRYLLAVTYFRRPRNSAAATTRMAATPAYMAAAPSLPLLSSSSIIPSQS